MKQTIKNKFCRFLIAHENLEDLVLKVPIASFQIQLINTLFIIAIYITAKHVIYFLKLLIFLNLIIILKIAISLITLKFSHRENLISIILID